MLQISQVKHPEGTIAADRCEDVTTTADVGEGYIVHFFVVSDQLSLHVTGYVTGSADYLFGFKVPDCTSRVD